MASSSSPSAAASPLPNGHLFSRTTTAIVYNYKQQPVQRMLDFDFCCRRETPSVAAVVTPGAAGGFAKFFFGQHEIAIPLYSSTREAAAKHPEADVFINLASFRSAFSSTQEALAIPTIRTLAVIAEGVPENDTRVLMAQAKRLHKTIIGPATVGGIQAGAFKIGDTAGEADNVIHCKLYRPGSVGFVSKSGGLSNEMYNVLSRTTDGLFEGIAIGGDVYPASGILDHVMRFEKIPEIKMIVVLGEVGGTIEYELADAVREGRVTKPVCAWVSGTIASAFQSAEVQFGHAGAKSGEDRRTSAEAKNAALKAAGVRVPKSFEDLAEVIRATFCFLADKGIIKAKIEPPVPTLPMDLSKAVKQGLVRCPTDVVSTICDERGEEPTYCRVPISQLIEQGANVGSVIALLWFKKPELLQVPWAAKFMERTIILVADHGPCVSGAHNTIVAARAGKDLVSSLVSGLVTIGPRFGGAIDDAARGFKLAMEQKWTAVEYVERMKAKGQRIAGIGHRIKSADNRDKRVKLLEEYARAEFPSTRFLDYALQVEAFTLTKAANLVLNVDGCLAALFLDMLTSLSDLFTKSEVDEIIDIGYLNGLFVLGRSIGLIGHALDQKRLKQPLYRHPHDSVLYSE